MAKSSVMVPIPQMIDLALNSPEVGAINFNILHALLHVIVQRIQLHEARVEFRGVSGDRVQSLLVNKKMETILNLTEYSILPQTAEIKTDKKGKGPKEDASVGQTVVLVETVTQKDFIPQLSIAIDKQQYETLVNDVKEMKVELEELKEIPKNTTIIEALRNQSTDKSNPILDMFQILSLSKRIDGIESGLNKLGSVLEDVVKVNNEVQTGATERKTSDQFSQQYDKSSNYTITTKSTVTTMVDSRQTSQASQITGHDNTTKSLRSIKQEQISAKSKLDDVVERLSMVEDHIHPDNLKKRRSTSITFTNVCGATDKFDLPTLIAKVEKMHSTLYGNAIVEIASTNTEETVSDNYNVVKGPPGLETKLRELEEYVRALELESGNLTFDILQRLTKFEGEMGELVEASNIKDNRSADVIDYQLVSDIQSKMIFIERDINEMAKSIAEIVKDRLHKDQIFDIFRDQLDALDANKANREELEDALADKADTCVINKKVSLDQFDMLCTDMGKEMSVVEMKLKRKMDAWQQLMDDLQMVLNEKLSRDDLKPLQEFLSKKLRNMQRNMKLMIDLKRDPEAAGAKMVLRNVNCISCDADVLMKKMVPPELCSSSEHLPPSQGNAPQHAYELNELRDQKNLVNRYCGGSHTITTRFQRLGKMDTFNKHVKLTSSDNQHKTPCGTSTSLVQDTLHVAQVKKDKSRMPSWSFHRDSQMNAGSFRKSQDLTRLPPIDMPKLDKSNISQIGEAIKRSFLSTSTADYQKLPQI